ncbi:Ig-like domain repeat protein [Nocardioides allogilvus]|uniref:Ig-like domain repeat protein n=1 Tax=Nocardioides allogilvus TaxID=2072017 RepID=UPI000D327DC6|nr:Ig-like domain repeat protein [Nocardioides allogilvus]
MTTTKRATAGAFVLAATLGLGATSVVPAQSAVMAAPTGTTTTVAVQSPTVVYGDTTKLTVSVDAASNGAKPAGKVEVEVGDKTLVADVTNSGKVDFDWPLVDASRTPYAVTASFVPTDATAFSTSASAPVNVTVVKSPTATTLAARHNKLKRKIVATSATTSAHGQVPTGKVKFVLKRNGRRTAATVVPLTSTAAAKAVFRKVSSKGRYKVVAKYLGSVNFLRSKTSFDITS